MKKILCAVLCIFLLCSCKAKQITAITRNIKMNAAFSAGGQTFECTCEAGENGQFAAAFTKPEALKGLTYSYTDAGYEIEYLGVKYTSSDKESAFLAASDKLCTAFREANGKNLIKSGNDYVFEFGGGRMYFDKNGLPVRADTAGVKFEFTDVKQNG